MFKHVFALPFLLKHTTAKNDSLGAHLEHVTGLTSGSVVADEKSVVRPHVSRLLGKSFPQGSANIASVQTPPHGDKSQGFLRTF